MIAEVWDVDIQLAGRLDQVGAFRHLNFLIVDG